MCVRDLQRLGELQTELAGAADFCATYLRCQLLLMKVRVVMSDTIVPFVKTEATWEVITSM